MDNTLDYQFRDHKIDPCFSSLSDETLNRDVKPKFITHLRTELDFWDVLSIPNLDPPN